MRRLIVCALLAGAVSSIGATDAPPPAKPPACASRSAHSQFDFWIGHWEVRDPAGKLQGHSRIERILDGCGIAEYWDGAGGTHGVSYNAFDAAANTWRQFWIDDSGQSVLQLEGGLKDRSMVLASVPKTVKGKAAPVQRITWTPQADGGVRQVWDQSDDGGKTWKIAFDGIYRKDAG